MGIHTNSMCQQQLEQLIRQPSWAGAASRKAPRPLSAATLPAPSTGAIRGYSPLNDDFVQGGRRPMRMRRQSAPEIIPRGARIRRCSAPDITAPRKTTTLRPLPTKHKAGAGRPLKKRKTRSATPGSVEALASTVQIPRKQFAIVKKIFDEHDEDGDGLIDEKEFIAAVAKADLRVGERVKARFVGDKNMGETAGDIAAKRRVEKGMVKHAQAMFLSVVAKKKGASQISLVDFVAMFYPHLSRAAVERACKQYQPKPKPAPKEPTLDDVEGAREEISDMFKGLDHDRDGLIRMRSLTPLAIKIGLSHDDLQEWLTELPPALYRAHGSHNLEAKHLSMERRRSKLTHEDFERLLAPVYLETPEQLDTEGLRRQREFNADLAQDVLYSY